MGLTKDIADLLASIPVNAVLRERVTEIKTRCEALEQKVIDLEKQNCRLVQENAELNGKLLAKGSPEQWINSRGVRFKKTAKGGIEPDAYCARCDDTTLFAIDNDFPLSC